jgi:hypothetical protein
MTRHLLSAQRRISENRKLSVALLVVGALLAIVEPAAARIGANHNETLLSDES